VGGDPPLEHRFRFTCGISLDILDAQFLDSSISWAHETMMVWLNRSACSAGTPCRSR